MRSDNRSANAAGWQRRDNDARRSRTLCLRSGESDYAVLALNSALHGVCNEEFCGSCLKDCMTKVKGVWMCVTCANEKKRKGR